MIFPLAQDPLRPVRGRGALPTLIREAALLAGGPCWTGRDGLTARLWTGLWTVGSGLLTVDCWQWTVGSGLWTVGSGLLAVDCWQWTVDCGLWSVGSGLLAVDCDCTSEGTALHWEKH